MAGIKKKRDNVGVSNRLYNFVKTDRTFKNKFDLKNDKDVKLTILEPKFINFPLKLPQTVPILDKLKNDFK